MKVIHIYPYTVRVSGGHSNGITAIIETQRAHDIEAIGISPITTDDLSCQINLPDYINEVSYDDPDSLIEIIKSQANGSAAIVHIHAINSETTRIARILSECRIPLVLTSHGQLNSRCLTHALKKILYLLLRDSPIKYAKGLHLLTDKELSRLRFIAPWYRGLKYSIPFPATIPSSDPPKIDKTTFDILYLGRLDVRTKGLDALLKGFAKADISNSRLILAGPDWDNGRSRLLHLASELNCSERVLFPGATYGAEKIKLLSQSDVMACCSRWDAFNLSLTDAMASGLPTIISNRLNLAPQLQEADASEIVELSPCSIADSLCRLADDNKRLSELSVNGKQWLRQNCHPAMVARQFFNLYQEVINTAD